MKTYHNTDRSRRAYYDPHLRMWTMLELDREGNQIGNAEYHKSRTVVLGWLKETKK